MYVHNSSSLSSMSAAALDHFQFIYGVRVCVRERKRAPANCALSEQKNNWFCLPHTPQTVLLFLQHAKLDLAITKMQKQLNSEVSIYY